MLFTKGNLSFERKRTRNGGYKKLKRGADIQKHDGRLVRCHHEHNDLISKVRAGRYVAQSL